MSQSNIFYTIFIDNEKFMLSGQTLLKNKNFLLSKILRGEFHNPSVILKENIFYIDRDPTSFKYILDILRGYTTLSNDYINTIEDEYLLNKINQDLKFYGLSQDSFDKIITETNELIKNVDDETSYKKDESYESILKNTSEEYDEKGLFLLNNLKTLFQSQKDLRNKKNIISESSSKNLLDSASSSLTNSIINLNKLQGGNPFELINNISNDLNVKNMLNNLLNENRNSDSDVESLDLDKVNELSEDLEQSEDLEYYQKYVLTNNDIKELSQEEENIDSKESSDEEDEKSKQMAQIIKGNDVFQIIKGNDPEINIIKDNSRVKARYFQIEK